MGNLDALKDVVPVHRVVVEVNDVPLYWDLTVINFIFTQV
jgi:hypothetical protein